MSSSQDPIIVLVEHRPDYRAIYGMNLFLYLGAQVLVANTIKEAMAHIETKKVALVFINNDAYTQDIGSEIWKIFEKKRLEIPLFVLGDSKVPQDEVTLFDSNIQLRDVLQSIARSVEVTAKKMMEKEFPEYFPLPSEFIVPGWQTVIPIYKQSGNDFEVLFKSEDIILGDTLEEILSTQKTLYVDRDLRLKFVNSLTTQISAKLNDPNLSPEERMQVTATGYQMVMEQARKVGVAESTMAVANSCINSMMNIIETAPSLESLLSNLMNSPNSYRYRQSLLINYIGSHIIKKIPWGNKEQQEKFAFVSFFHNIALSKDEYVKITSDAELERSDLSDKEKELITNHALIAAKLVAAANVDGIPYEAPTIIKQHHGSRKGIGLSKLAMNISPLAMVFIFAEEWVNIVLKYENESARPDKKEIIRQLHQKYNKQGFNKILPILHTLEI